MPDEVQLKARVPQALKRQAFSVFALHGQKFSRWVRQQLAQMVEAHAAVEQPRPTPEPDHAPKA